tara:strand:+ start:1432 stop:1650 length:219 start_codon:yes stop_codon:yes gene_type:complete
MDTSITNQTPQESDSCRGFNPKSQTPLGFSRKVFNRPQIKGNSYKNLWQRRWSMAAEFTVHGAWAVFQGHWV